VAGVNYQFPGEGSRDALCALIGKTVRSALGVDEEAISLEFYSGERVQITQRAYPHIEAFYW
jgi:hypothetical protein